jgi:hypothetical protein
LIWLAKLAMCERCSGKSRASDSFCDGCFLLSALVRPGDGEKALSDEAFGGVDWRGWGSVGENNPRYADVWNYSEIYPHMLKEMTHFFAIYKDLEGERVEAKGWHDAAFARDKVSEAVHRFKDKKVSPELGGNR